MWRVIDSCEVGKSPDAPRLIRATGKEKPGAMSGLRVGLHVICKILNATHCIGNFEFFNMLTLFNQHCSNAEFECRVNKSIGIAFRCSAQQVVLQF